MLGLVLLTMLIIWGLFAFAAVKLKISELTEDINWKHIFGASILGSIGFTMSIFITLLAFENGGKTIESKIAVLLSSFTAGLLGYFYLKQLSKENNNNVV